MREVVEKFEAREPRDLLPLTPAVLNILLALADEEDTQYYGPSEWLHLSDEGGLTQFGAHVHTLRPGTRSSDRHWHEEQDEFLYMLSGEATVIEEDGLHLLQAGDVAAGQRWRRQELPGLRPHRPSRGAPGRAVPDEHPASAAAC